MFHLFEKCFVSEKQKNLAKRVRQTVGPAAVSAAAVVIKDTNWVGLFHGMGQVVGGIEKVLMSYGAAPFGLFSRAYNILSHKNLVLIILLFILFVKSFGVFVSRKFIS